MDQKNMKEYDQRKSNMCVCVCIYIYIYIYREREREREREYSTVLFDVTSQDKIISLTDQFSVL